MRFSNMKKQILLMLSAAGSRISHAEALPYAIRRYQVKLLFVSSIFLIAGLSISLHLRAISPCLLCLFSVYLCWRALCVGERYKSGRIREIAVLCTSVSPSRIRNTLIVTFRTEVENCPSGQEYFRFINQSKSEIGNFLVNHPYVIYYDTTDPQTLLTYVTV